MEHVEVAIVGGGPAGSSAAWTAAEHGANAVVFEKGVPREDRDGPGPDSTDAAGLLDYWVDLMGFDPEEIPDEVVLRELDGAEFIGPSETLSIGETGIPSSYPSFGLAFDRAAFDDWLHEESEAAGANHRVGDAVVDVETDLSGREPEHTLTLGDGTQFTADYVVLADGPQRTVTIETLDQFTPPDQQMGDLLDPSQVNHIAYQEHRELPAGLVDSSQLQFWWGHMPGHTAYPWVFPNDNNVARIGLTMPIGLDIDRFDTAEWPLLRSDDDRIPRGAEYLERLVEHAYPGYELEDMPLVEGRGKRDGTETYAISSTRPIESPTGANIAVVGGAMGGTSAFHEGGDHVAVRTGKIAGELAATGNLERYNQSWQSVLDEEFYRNVAVADIVRDYGPTDWDQAFRLADTVMNSSRVKAAFRAGVPGLRLLWRYWRSGNRLENGGYVQFRESEYAV
jgi:electron-transferring-flavoprotein dehydrogenase